VVRTLRGRNGERSRSARATIRSPRQAEKLPPRTRTCAARRRPTSTTITTTTSASKGAFTLVEILFTMGIAAIVMSMSIAGYLLLGRSLAYNASAQLVQGQLLAARNTAVSQHSDSFVILDAKNNLIQTFGQVAVGIWHFDDGSPGETIPQRGGDYFTDGAVGQKGYLKDGNGNGKAATLVNGRYGAGLQFPGSAVTEAERLYVECGKAKAYIPKYNAREGIALSAWVYAENESDGSALAAGEFLPIVTKNGGSVESADPYAPYTLFLEYSQTESKFKAGGLATLEGDTVKEVVTTAAIVPPQTWTHLSMDYANGGSGLRLYVNGVLRATTAASGQLKLSQQPVRLGMAKDTRRAGGTTISSAYFSGIIDEVRMAVYEKGRKERIPQKVTVIVLDPANGDEQGDEWWNYRIYFDPRGYLDRQRHPWQPEIVILSPLVDWPNRFPAEGLPEVHTLYQSKDSASDGVSKYRRWYPARESDRKLYVEMNLFHSLRLTWAGTVE